MDKIHKYRLVWRHMGGLVRIDWLKMSPDSQHVCVHWSVSLHQVLFRLISHSWANNSLYWWSCHHCPEAENIKKIEVKQDFFKTKSFDEVFWSQKTLYLEYSNTFFQVVINWIWKLIGMPTSHQLLFWEICPTVHLSVSVGRSLKQLTPSCDAILIVQCLGNQDCEIRR